MSRVFRKPYPFPQSDKISTFLPVVFSENPTQNRCRTGTNNQHNQLSFNVLNKKWGLKPRQLTIICQIF